MSVTGRLVVVYLFFVSRAKSVLGTCVRVTEAPVEVFSKFLLLFSLTDWMQGEEDNGFSQIM